MLWNIEFKSILPLLSEKLLHVNVTSEGKSWSITSRSSNQQDQGHNVCTIAIFPLFKFY